MDTFLLTILEPADQAIGKTIRIKGMNRRRATISILGGAVLVTMGGALAADGARMAHIGFIATANPGEYPQLDAFRAGLRELGLIEGKNIHIEYRWAPGKLDERPDIAHELLRQGVDLIVTWGTAATAAAKAATATVPIVMVAVADPVGSGFANSLGRPGGNITGASNAMVAIGGKWVELMNQVAPDVKTIAILRNPDNGGSVAWTREAEDAAKTFDLDTLVLDASSNSEIERSFDEIKRKGAGALIITGDPLFASAGKRLAELTTKHRLPSSFVASYYPESGGLMSYGMDVKAMFRRAANIVARILNGAKPADLPIERPTVFELVINLKTAKAIGIEFPRSILLRAHRIIE